MLLPTGKGAPAALQRALFVARSPDAGSSGLAL